MVTFPMEEGYLNLKMNETGVLREAAVQDEVSPGHVPCSGVGHTRAISTFAMCSPNHCILPFILWGITPNPSNKLPFSLFKWDFCCLQSKHPNSIILNALEYIQIPHVFNILGENPSLCD